MTSPTVHTQRESEERVIALLKAHIPLSLLLDLAYPDPRSRELYEKERVTPS
jgi:hypothetical protein